MENTASVGGSSPKINSVSKEIRSQLNEEAHKLDVKDSTLSKRNIRKKPLDKGYVTIRPQRKRTTSVSRSSHVVLERKRRNSLRIKTLMKEEKKSQTKAIDEKKSRLVKTVKPSKVTRKPRKVIKKKYLGRKCKRKRETVDRKSNAPRPKRRKLNSLRSKATKGKSTKKSASGNDRKSAQKRPKDIISSSSSDAQTNTSQQDTSNKVESTMGTKGVPPKGEASKTSPNPSRAQILSLPSLETPKKTETLLEKEFPEDDDDEEYKPDEDELNALDDTMENKSVTEEVDFEEPGKCIAGAEEQPVDSVHYMTRSKVSYTDQALEDMEKAFIPPDIDLDMYDCVIDDQDWKEFLTEFTKPIDKINTNEDDDTEFIPNIHEEEIDSEELRRDPGVKVSKKELNELMGELFDFNEICDFDGNDDGNIDNINDYVNLKFNETVSDGAVNRSTPKKVHFADTGNSSRDSSTQKQGSCRKTDASKARKKNTPDKNRKDVSDEISKQIMDEINREIQKYIEINETYVYGSGNGAANYDNYEEYIVVIGSDEPSTEEINKLAQVKMAENDEFAQKAKGNIAEAADGETANSQEKNEDTQSKEDGQQLSIKLVQKTLLSSKMNNRKPPPQKEKEAPKKPPKEKKEGGDPKRKYRDLTKKQYINLRDTYLNAIEMYKTKNQITNEDELSYRCTIHSYGSLLYRKTCDQSTISMSYLEDPTIAILNEENASKENNISSIKDTTFDKMANNGRERTPLSPLQQNSSPDNSDSDDTIEKELKAAIMNDDELMRENSTDVKLMNPNNKETTVNAIRHKSPTVTKDTENKEIDNSRTGKEDIARDASNTNHTNEELPSHTGEANKESLTRSGNIETEVAQLHLFETEDLKLLQQQINQHIQYSLQHYLQTYNHPRFYNLSRQAKQMIEIFHQQSRRKRGRSLFKALNIESAMLLVNSWEGMSKNDAFNTHIRQEWARCFPRWRERGDTLTLPQLVTTTILNNEAFIYPVLLPPKSFAPTPRDHRLNTLDMSCELNLLVLGLLNYVRLLKKTTKFRRLSLFFDVLNAIQRNYLPAHTTKNIAKRIFELIESPQTNAVQKFFKAGDVEELRHYIIDYSEDNIVAPKYQYLQLLPLAWQDCVREFR